MSGSNGVIRVGRKGRKKFAFGEEGTPGSEPFEVDVVVAFQQYITLDESFRDQSENGDRTIPLAMMGEYHKTVVEFVQSLATNLATGEQPQLTTAEALDFIARLREQYDEMVDFFQPKSRERQELLATSGVEMRFSAEPN